MFLSFAEVWNWYCCTEGLGAQTFKNGRDLDTPWAVFCVGSLNADWKREREACMDLYIILFPRRGLY
jgi:hypothetical protein